MPVTGNNHIHYNLSIRITADGFSFFVTEALSGDLMHREDYSAKDNATLCLLLKQACVRPSITRHTYDVVRVVIDSDSTCLPLEEFHEEYLASLYQQVFIKADLFYNKVCYTLLPELGVVEAFTIPKELHDTLREYFPEAQFSNSYAIVLQRVSQYCQQHELSERPLFAYVQASQLFLFSIHRGQLLFANSFTVEKEQNALFFLLSVWKEMGLDVHQNPCFISGDPLPAQHLVEEAKNYLQHVQELSSIDLAHL